MAYKHTVQYYETDKMGITHHSNYIRFMEEARVAFLGSIGWGYDKLEEQGIISPVVSVKCDYKRPTKFADEIEITIRIAELTRVKLVIAYSMTVRGECVCEAESCHCFVSETGRPISLQRSYPEFYEALEKLSGKPV